MLDWNDVQCSCHTCKDACLYTSASVPLWCVLCCCLDVVCRIHTRRKVLSCCMQVLLLCACWAGWLTCACAAHLHLMCACGIPLCIVRLYINAWRVCRHCQHPLMALPRPSQGRKIKCHVVVGGCVLLSVCKKLQCCFVWVPVLLVEW